MKNSNLKLGTFFASLFLLASSSHVLAEGSNQKKQKVIDFEGELVEGVNRRPLDSVSETADPRKRKKNAHLYQKRMGFSEESRLTLQEMRVK